MRPRELLPLLPHEGPPLPRFLTHEQTEAARGPSIKDCEHGIQCLLNHFLRADLYMLEAIRFSSEGEITPEAISKIRLAKQQLLAEDDFQEALGVEGELKYEMMKVLASARSTWRAIEQSGLDNGDGTVEDLQEARDAVRALYEAMYVIEKKHQTGKTAGSSPKDSSPPSPT